MALYAIAIGSNRRGRHGGPDAEARAAIAALTPIAVARLRRSAPLGPSHRTFVNTAVLIESAEEPRALLLRLKSIERAFGRRRGQRWGARVIDLDIVLWSEGVHGQPDLVVPHRDFRVRAFVLDPLVDIAGDWRDPLTGRTVRQLAHRCRAAARRPVDRRTARA